jgi:hypothetical protein
MIGGIVSGHFLLWRALRRKPSVTGVFSANHISIW